MEAPDLKIRLQPKQARLRHLTEESIASWLGYGGALGGAKSAGIRYVQLLRRFKYDGTNGLIFRRKRKELNENHIEPLFREYPKLRRYWRAVDRQLRLPNESVLYFGHGDTDKDIEDFLGNEYMDVAVDQAEKLTEQSLRLLQSRARWPGTPDGSCKTILGFNPGGPASGFLRRVFVDRDYHTDERAEDFEFIQAYGWDNIEWTRSWLTQQGISEATYYRRWTDQQRFAAFTENSEYGRKLMRMPDGLRAGWLYGRFDSYAGQYFENFQRERHVVWPDAMQARPWLKRWASVDWGYQHNAAVYWYQQAYHGDPDSAPGISPVVYVYRELVQNRLGSRALGEKIAEMTGDEKLDAIYVSPDSKQHRDDVETVYDQINAVLRRRGLPLMTLADNERVGGWRLVYDMLGTGDAAPELVIGAQCPRLIATLPMMSRDPNRLEDCQKFNSNDEGEGGDDPADSLRYGLKSRPNVRRKPVQQEMQEQLAGVEDMTTKAMMHRRLLAKVRRQVKTFRLRR